MALRNGDVADLFDLLASLSELDGAIVHKVIAYRRAAEQFRTTAESVERMAEEGRLTDLPGVGATIAAKVDEIRATGTMQALEKLREKYPDGLVEMMAVPGVGPKTAKRLYAELGIDSPATLKAACEAGQLRELKGLGAKKEQTILAALAAGGGPRKHVILLDHALDRAEMLVEALRAEPGCREAEIAGSLRRRKEVIGDVDLVASSEDPGPLLRRFAEHPGVQEVIALGDAKASVVLHDGLQVDLRVIHPTQWGSLLQHFTGSKEHNVALRERARDQGLTLSEHGFAPLAGGDPAPCADEAEVYGRLGLDWIPPELRENQGEIEAAATGALPKLVTLKDLRGDLHGHSDASDGKATPQEMARAAIARGLTYYAVTDHSKAVGMGIGLDADATLANARRVRKAAKAFEPDGFHLLSGIEVDILPGGVLDLPDEVLADLDWVVASAHGVRGQDRAELTASMVAAIEHPHVDVIAHPTGRLLDGRDPYDVDVEALIAACARTGTFLEVNANPKRLDLRPEHIRAAIAAGVKLCVSSDAHRTDGLDVLRYGIDTARRGWATKADIVNTRTWPQIRKLRKRSAR
ncbi:MAG: DNA polymerase/3'-5' exonuclease PolX [Gaiellales bacterium]